MSKIRSIFVLLSIFAVVFSCGTNDNVSNATFEVVYTDFENAITTVGFVEPIKSVNIICPQNLDATIIYLAEEGSIVKKGDTICILEDINISSQYENFLLRVEQIKIDVDKAKANLVVQYAILESQVQTNQAEMEMAKADSSQLKFLIPSQRRIKELEIRQAAINNQKLIRKLASLKIIQQVEISTLETALRRLQSDVQRVDEMIASTTITAPSDGIAIRADKLMEGDNVWAGMNILMLPDVSVMKVKMNITEMDYKLITVGDSVTYTFDALPGITAGGKVISKAPVGQQVSKGSKVKFYDVEASLINPETIPDPGFSANAKIILKQIKDTLVVPQIAVFDDDSVKVAYVRTRNGYEARQVVTGVGSYRDIIVERGLTHGDVVSLTRPESSMIKSRKLLIDSVLMQPDSIKINADSNIK